MGVGMGGMRTNGHGKVDQISYGRLGAPLPVEENPFLDTRPMGLVSPGAVTFHRPGSEEDPDNTAMASRPQLRAPQTRLESSLLSPPPTQKALRIRTPPRSVRENAERQHKKEEMKRMMDAESNPFLSQPGELIQPGRAGPIVDESSPTVTYVFRGAKKVFANPFLRPDQPFPAATLDPEDDEFEPHPCPDPRLLWPSGPGMEAGGSSSREASPPTSPVATPRFSGRERAGMGGDLDISGPKHAFTDEEVYASESEEELPARRGLLFTGGGGIKRASLGGEDGRAKAKKAKGRRL